MIYNDPAVFMRKQVTLISFAIGGVSYQAEEGMTWAEWCNSEYNVDGCYVETSEVRTSLGGFISDAEILRGVRGYDIIKEGGSYYITSVPEIEGK